MHDPVCLAQALVRMHASGRGMWDLKHDNIMVVVAEDGLTFSRVTVIDLGASGNYHGEPMCHLCC